MGVSAHFQTGRVFLKLDDRWHKFGPRQGEGERGFSPRNEIPDVSSISQVIFIHTAAEICTYLDRPYIFLRYHFVTSQGQSTK